MVSLFIHQPKDGIKQKTEKHGAIIKKIVTVIFIFFKVNLYYIVVQNTTSIGMVLWQLEYLKQGKMIIIIITLPIIVAKFSKSQVGFNMRENGIIQKMESCTLMELKQLVAKNTISCIMQRCIQGILQKHIMPAVKFII